jgi:hypothetical protein
MDLPQRTNNRRNRSRVVHPLGPLVTRSDPARRQQSGCDDFEEDPRREQKKEHRATSLYRPSIFITDTRVARLEGTTPKKRGEWCPKGTIFPARQTVPAGGFRCARKGSLANSRKRGAQIENVQLKLKRMGDIAETGRDFAAIAEVEARELMPLLAQRSSRTTISRLTAAPSA